MQLGKERLLIKEKNLSFMSGSSPIALVGVFLRL
jgi:hypothetical protein